MFTTDGVTAVVDYSIPAFHKQIETKRKRIVVGVLDLVVEVFAEAHVPAENLPSAEVFKTLVQRVSVLLASESV